MWDEGRQIRTYNVLAKLQHPRMAKCLLSIKRYTQEKFRRLPMLADKKRQAQIGTGGQIA